MTTEELRLDYERFLMLKSIDDCVEIIDVYLDFFMKVIRKHPVNPVL